MTANQCDEPARAEFQRVQFEIRIGRDPGEALSATATRMASKDFDWVVAAIQINREIGGELAVVLDNVAETIRERQKMHRQIRVLTAEGANLRLHTHRVTNFSRRSTEHHERRIFRPAASVVRAVARHLCRRHDDDRLVLDAPPRQGTDVRVGRWN